MTMNGKENNKQNVLKTSGKTQDYAKHEPD